MTDDLKWLLENGHDVVYQTRMNGVRGHFLTVLYLEAPYMSFHKSQLIEGEDFDDCLNAARAFVEMATGKDSSGMKVWV